MAAAAMLIDPLCLSLTGVSPVVSFKSCLLPFVEMCGVSVFPMIEIHNSFGLLDGLSDSCKDFTSFVSLAEIVTDDSVVDASLLVDSQSLKVDCDVNMGCGCDCGSGDCAFDVFCLAMHSGSCLDSSLVLVDDFKTTEITEEMLHTSLFSLSEEYVHDMSSEHVVSSLSTAEVLLDCAPVTTLLANEEGIGSELFNIEEAKLVDDLVFDNKLMITDEVVHDDEMVLTDGLLSIVEGIHNDECSFDIEMRKAVELVTSVEIETSVELIHGVVIVITDETVSVDELALATVFLVVSDGLVLTEAETDETFKVVAPQVFFPPSCAPLGSDVVLAPSDEMLHPVANISSFSVVDGSVASVISDVNFMNFANHELVPAMDLVHEDSQACVSADSPVYTYVGCSGSRKGKSKMVGSGMVRRSLRLSGSRGRSLSTCTGGCFPDSGASSSASGSDSVILWPIIFEACFKETGNGQGGKSKLNPACLVPETSVTSATAASKSVQNGGHAQRTSQGASTYPALPKEQMPQSAPIVLDSAERRTPIKEGTKTVALQFGTISPGVINGLKIPVRTSSAPPNLDEQKQDQARQAALRAAPTQPIPPNTLQKQQQQTLTRNDPRVINQPSSQVHPKITTAPPVAIPSVVPPPNSSNMPIQGVSLPMGFQQPPFSIQFGNPAPQQIPIMNEPHSQPLFLHNFPPHPMQHPIMHQNFQMVPQSASFGVGSVPTPQFVYQPLPVNFATSPRRNSPVKITNPKTREELRLDSRTDNNSNGNTNHTQIQQHQQPISLNSNGVTINMGQNNQVCQVGQSRQTISFMVPLGSTQGLMKSNGVQADQKSVFPTTTATVPSVTITKGSKSRDSVASVLTPKEVPSASAMSIQAVVENNAEKAIASTFAATTKDDELPRKNQLTTTTDLPSGTGVKIVEALGSTGPSSSVTEVSKNKSKDSDSICSISVNVDGRNNSLNKPELEKSEVSKSTVDSRVCLFPTISDSSQNAKPLVLSKHEVKQINSSENKINSNDNKNELKTISNHDVHSTTSGTKDSDVLESTKVKPCTGKKKKRRDLLLKADAACDTDLYNAYKRHGEKPQVIDTSESTNAFPTVNNKKEHTNDSKNIVATFEEKEIKAEDDNWEDAADVTVSDNILIIEAKDTKKYTLDFLLTFSEHCTDLPVSLVIGSDIAKVLLSTSSHAVNPSPGRSSGGSRGDHRGNNMFGDDKWNKAANSLPLRDLRNDPNYGVSRYPHGQPVNQYYPSPNNLMPQMVSSHGALMRNNSDNDRWRSLNNSRGLIPPPPPTHLQVMHKAENKYVVGKISDEEQAKQRQLKGILNKLTPQNFEKLFQQVKDVNIDNTVTLFGVIAQIFDKALTEPTFCEMYADFCYHLSDALPYFMENGEKITFKRLLLTKCQEEFERGEREQAEANKDEEEGEVKQTEQEREEKRSKARRRMLGNIRLVGEIYKKRMLTERIIHECIQKLLGEYGNPDEENLESLCKLMATVGDQIDNAKAREFMNSYFDAIVKLSNNKKLTSRLRFMLRDVVDLRNNRWQQRRKVEGPKKIEDVHRDAAQEKISQTNRLNRATSMNFNQRRTPAGDYNSRSSSLLPSPNSQPSSIRGFPNQAHGYVAQDARLYEHHPLENRALSFPSTQRPINDNLITFGPQGGLARGMSFRQPPPNGNTSTSNGTKNQARKDFAWGSLPNREQNLQGQNAAVHDLEPRATSPNGQSQGSTVGKPLSEEVLEERSMATIREFYSVKDEKEVALCIRELNSPSFYPSIVSLWVTDSFERKDKERELLAKLLVNLCKAHDHALSQIQLIQGFESVLSMLEDTVTDAPRAAKFLGRIFVKIILENVIPLRDIGRIIHEGGEEPGRLLEIGLASEVLGSILEIIKEEKGDLIVKEIITNSSLRLEEFRAPDPMKSKKLDVFL